jgi:hypothetical protein
MFPAIRPLNTAQLLRQQAPGVVHQSQGGAIVKGSVATNAWMIANTAASPMKVPRHFPPRRRATRTIVDVAAVPPRDGP